MLVMMTRERERVLGNFCRHFKKVPFNIYVVGSFAGFFEKMFQYCHCRTSKKRRYSEYL